MARAFTPEERTLIDYLLHPALKDVDQWRAQLRVAQFDAPWFEGSQSFDIVVPLPPLAADSSSPIEGAGCAVYRTGAKHTNRNYVGEVFLWQTNGLLSALEYSWVTEEMPSTLPHISQLGPLSSHS